MRNLALNEVYAVAGGTHHDYSGNYFSDAFIAGMTGESYSYASSLIWGIVLGGTLGGLALLGHPAWPVSAVIGAAIGPVISVAVTNYEYHSGQNYMKAMSLIK